MIAGPSGVDRQNLFSAAIAAKSTDQISDFKTTLSGLLTDKLKSCREVLPGVYCPNPNPQTLASLQISQGNKADSAV